MPFFLARNEITKMLVDVVVNPTNTRLQEDEGITRTIFLAAGEERLTEACSGIGYCAPGDAVITSGFGLPAKHIIHAAGPVWQGGEFGEKEVLYSAYLQSLKRAQECEADSIAFPLLSVENHGYPEEQSFRIAMSAVRDFLSENDMLVYLVLYDVQDFRLSQKFSELVRKYIDDHYVEGHKELFHLPCGDSENRSEQWKDRKELSVCLASPSKEPYEPTVYQSIQKEGKRDLETSRLFRKKKRRSLDTLMAHMGETFSQMLIRLIDEKGYTDAQVYRRANIDRRHFSKIRNNINYVPNKRTVLAFAIALTLSLDETDDLLRTAGFSFSNSSKSDIIVRYFMENKNYDVYEINEMLFFYDQPLIGG